MVPRTVVKGETPIAGWGNTATGEDGVSGNVLRDYAT